MANEAFAVQFSHVVLSFLQIVGRKVVADAAMAEDASMDCDMQARFCSLTVQVVWLCQRHTGITTVQEETAVSCHAVGAASTPTTSLASLNAEAGQAERKEW